MTMAGSDLSTEFIQSEILKLMEAVDSIFEKHDIWYSLSCGSVLGAVRHHGFIPWDEDIDIFIQIEDMDKVRKVLNTSLPEGILLQNYDEDACGSSHDAIYFSAFPSELVHLDIFPLVGTPNSKIQRFIFVKVCHYLNRVFRCKYAVGYFIKGIPKRTIFKILKIALRLFPDPLIRKIYHKLEQAYPIKDSKYLTYIANEGSIRECISKEKYFDTMKCAFEHMQLPIPRDFHFYLTNIYGEDYMTPKQY